MANVCPECGQAFSQPAKTAKGGRPRTFCSDEHKTAFHRREQKEGRAIIALAKAWRVSRNRSEDRETGRKALSEMCSILDGFISDDRKAGRPRPTQYVNQMLSTGFLYIDRKRS